jgi:hypothetical protein
MNGYGKRVAILWMQTNANNRDVSSFVAQICNSAYLM